MNRNSKLLIAGLIIALSIAILAPFLASSNPDGLESTAEEVDEAEDREAGYYEAPMPDYAFPGIGDERFAGVMAIVIGTVLMFLLALIFFTLTPKKNRKSDDITEEG